MKKLLFSILSLNSLLFNSSLYSQCKYLREGKDEFTGQYIKETKYGGSDLVTSNCKDCGFAGSFAFEKYDSSLVFKVYINYADDFWTIDKGDIAMLKFENGEILELNSLDNTFPGSRVSGDAKEVGTHWVGIIRFYIPYNYWGLLLKSKPDLLRIYFNSGFQNARFDGSGKVKFVEDLNCVMK